MAVQRNMQAIADDLVKLSGGKLRRRDVTSFDGVTLAEFGEVVRGAGIPVDLALEIAERHSFEDHGTPMPRHDFGAN